MNEKRSLIPWELRAPICKINFCSSVLRLSELPRCKERPQTPVCCLEWLGRLKCLTTCLDASSSFNSSSRRCSRNRSPSRLPVSIMHNLLQYCNLLRCALSFSFRKENSDNVFPVLSRGKKKWSKLYRDNWAPLCCDI